MILYHGSNIPIERIDLSRSRPYKDFGRAFYLSAEKEQAEAMARFKTMIEGGSPTITAFQFEGTNEMKTLRFEEYTVEWAEFVYNNRDERQNFAHPYDVVYGPIANDTVGVQIRDLRERKYRLTLSSTTSNIGGASHFNMHSAPIWPFQNSQGYECYHR